MKNIVFFITLLFCFPSCSVHHSISSLTITTTLATDETDLKNIYGLEINAIDNDGILSITVEIDMLDIHDTYRNIKGKEWQYERTIVIKDESQLNTLEIKVTLIDGNGDEKIKVTPLIS